MKARFVFASALLITASGVANAQANTCPAGAAPGGIPDRQRATQDACQQAVDIFQYVAPQLGTAIAGGNATLGQGGSLGGLGHFSLGVRVNAVMGEVPDFSKFTSPSVTGRPASRELPSKKGVVPMPVVDGALGIFKGIPLGITNVGGLDLLASVSYLPKYGESGDDFQLAPKKSTQFGYGARLGLIQETLIAPGVSVSYLRRDLPETDLFGHSDPMDVKVTGMKVNTTAWRAVVSKSLLVVGLAVGVGQDKYDQEATVQGTVNSFGGVVGQSSDQILLKQNMTRTNVFADLSLNLPLLKLVVEGGQVSGGKVQQNMYNTFSGGSADKSRLYASAGLRFKI